MSNHYCAWCKRWFDADWKPFVSSEVPTTHGICPSCSTNFLASKILETDSRLTEHSGIDSLNEKQRREERLVIAGSLGFVALLYLVIYIIHKAFNE